MPTETSARVPGLALSRHQAAWLGSALLLLGLGLAGFIATSTGLWGQADLNTASYYLAMVLATGICGARALLVGTERRAWFCITLTLACSRRSPTCSGSPRTSSSPPGSSSCSLNGSVGPARSSGSTP